MERILLAQKESCVKPSDYFISRRLPISCCLRRFNGNSTHRLLLTWGGGAWERMIRSVRQVLQVLLKEQRLDDKGLATVMCQAENIVNSRPLTHVSEDARDLQPLTPNYLLHLNATSVFPAEIFDEKDIYSRRRWRQVAYLSEFCLRRWHKQYVTLLQCRHKWQHACRNIKQDDIVLLLDDNVARGEWTLGRVLEVRRSSDGLVRSAKVKTAAGVFERPIAKMCFSEEHNV